VYKRLMERFKFAVYTRNLPERSFWMRLRDLDPEYRATAFVDRLWNATPEERKQLGEEVAIVEKAGGIITKEFMQEVLKLNEKRRVVEPDSVKPLVNVYKKEANLSDTEKIIHSKATNHGLDPALIAAMIEAESSWKNFAVSKVGAQGLMQLMPDTAKSLGVTDPFDPEQNIDGGIRYMKWLLKKYDGDTEIALAAYNWGPGNMDKWINKHGRTLPRVKETVKYVDEVISRMDKYNYLNEG